MRYVGFRYGTRQIAIYRLFDISVSYVSSYVKSKFTGHPHLHLHPGSTPGPSAAQCEARAPRALGTELHSHVNDTEPAPIYFYVRFKCASRILRAPIHVS